LVSFGIRVPPFAPTVKVFEPDTVTAPFSVTVPVRRPFENAVQHSTKLPGRAILRPARGHHNTPAVACEVEDAAAIDAIVGAIIDAIVDATLAQYLNC
jgi:hypothetical protein